MLTDKPSGTGLTTRQISSTTCGQPKCGQPCDRLGFVDLIAGMWIKRHGPDVVPKSDSDIRHDMAIYFETVSKKWGRKYGTMKVDGIGWQTQSNLKGYRGILWDTGIPHDVSLSSSHFLRLWFPGSRACEESLQTA